LTPPTRWKKQMRSEPHVTPARRLLVLVICALLLGAASVGLDAATAHAATIGPQSILRAPATFPVEFGGRAWDLGDRMPRGYAVVRRTITMARGERRKGVRYTCPRGTVAVQPAVPEWGRVGLNVRDTSQYRHPRRTFRFSVWPSPNLKAGSTTSPVYVLCGPRSELPGNA
jgi:hypothetical protein